MDALIAELPDGSAIAAYERGSAFDSTGHSDLAVPLYRQALAEGLPPGRRRQAVIQLASSLRNLGEVEESVALLTTERAAGYDELDDAVDAFLALSQADAGREREAVATALTALSRHMTRYRRSLSAYAEELADRG
jgi:tetratricopeptide (TPR) repeat protein